VFRSIGNAGNRSLKMSINGLWQIILARRAFIAICTVCCLIGVVIISLILPPIWQGQARVMLNLIKPDPVTNEMVAGSTGAASGAYVGTQMSLITDYTVTGKVVDALDWLSDPTLISRWNARSKDDRRDFRSWAADIIARNTKVKPLKDSTILEISYSANNPKAAKDVADALLKSYVDTAVALRTEDASRTAQWYEGELQKLKAKLDEAVTDESAYERANGLQMANDRMDVESERLQSLAGAGAPLMIPPAMVEASKATGMELAGVNAQIVAASKVLGPNNPQMQELQKKKAELESLDRKDEAAAHAAIAASQSSGSLIERQLAAQQSKVLAKSDQIAHLQTLHEDVQLRRNEFETAAQKFAVYRAEADQTIASSLTPLPTPPPANPLFPNWMLEIPGSIILGLGVGILGAMLLELLNRRVRSVEDLEDAVHLPAIGVIGASDRPSRPSQARRARPSRAAARAARA
jgi:polysaccharide biosynthesis transport protein